MKLQISDAEYFSRTELSNSDLSLIKQSWSHYLEKSRKVTSDAMIFGKAFDQYLLRKDEFFKNFVIASEDMDRRTKEGKAHYQSMLESGREILSHKQWMDLNQMKIAVESHPYVSQVIKESENEGVYTGIIEGVEVRCKIDIYNKGYLYDIKTCQSATTSDFARDIWNRDYHRQMAFYMEILKQNLEGVKGVALIPVQKPGSDYMPNNFGVNCIKLENSAIENGQIQYMKLLHKYKTYMQYPNLYPGLIDFNLALKENISYVVESLDIPPWKMEQ